MALKNQTCIRTAVLRFQYKHACIIHFLVIITSNFCNNLPFSFDQIPFFNLDLLVPITVDSKPSWNTLSLVPSNPLLNNVLLMAIFIIQHRCVCVCTRACVCVCACGVYVRVCVYRCMCACMHPHILCVRSHAFG